MSLTVGSVIGHYKITSLLGVGGMGEVYKAQDVNLERPVALKILPEHLVEDADRVRRFVQEAKSASALNHPHIITIYEIGQATPSQIIEIPKSGNEGTSAASSASIHYMAMEFVDGVTLHHKIHKESKDLKKLLSYLAQAAEGLAKAHTAGIVHRDLKPENIMITGDGYAKILDFGLAKLVEASDSKAAKPTGEELEEAATAVMNKTQPGMVMGTLGYMSPEQVQGKEVDQRSDIFSFGCILYEVTTSHKPFAGDSLIDSLHKIIYSQPQPIKELNPHAPVELQRIIRKCMAKDQAERYQSIKDVAIDLRDLVREYDEQPTVSGLYASPIPSGSHLQPSDSSSTFSGGQLRPSPTASQPQYQVTGQQQMISTDPNMGIANSGISGAVTGAVPVVRRKRQMMIIGGAIVLAVAVLGIFYALVWNRHSKSRMAPAFQTVKTSRLTNSGKSIGAIISPDGKYVAHIALDEGKQTLLVRQTATTGNVTVVEPDDKRIENLSFSPDSNFIYFTKLKEGEAIRTLYKVPSLGGTPPTEVLKDVDSAISFSPDGKRFAFVRGYPVQGESALLTINEDGSNEQRVALHSRGNFFMATAWSPNGKVLAATTRKTDDGVRVELLGVQLSDGSEQVIGTQRWGTITGIGWLADGSGLMLSGIERGPGSNKYQLFQMSYPEGKARRLTDGLTNYTGVSLTKDTYSLVSLQANVVAQLWLAPNGDAGKAKPITTGSINYSSLSWTADGKIVYMSDESGTFDIWIMDSEGKNKKQLTSNAGVNAYPSISQDGNYIIFNSNRGNDPSVFQVWRMNADGSNLKQLTQGPSAFYPTISPDGKWVLYAALNDTGKPNIYKMSIDGGDPVQLTKNVSVWPRVSPDGKFIACQYNEDQQPLPKMAIIPFEGGAPVKTFNIPLGQVTWSYDGKGLLYVDNKAGVSNIWIQPIDGSAAKQLTQFQTDNIFSYAWSRDGKQLLASRGNETTDAVLMKDESVAVNP
jgi:serine/threonine protein kinase/Tol biopolymer transport system component